MHNLYTQLDPQFSYIPNFVSMKQIASFCCYDKSSFNDKNELKSTSITQNTLLHQKKSFAISATK